HASPSSPGSPTDAANALALPTVRLELRYAAAKPTTYEIGDVGFLIGGVPGCDLRLPGPNLPSVVCLITREPHGVSLRKLAPFQAILVNDQAVSLAQLNHGDRIAVGQVELIVQIEAVAVAIVAGQGSVPAEIETLRQELEAR